MSQESSTSTRQTTSFDAMRDEGGRVLPVMTNESCHFMKCFRTAATGYDSLMIFYSVLATADNQHTEKFHKGMLRELQLILARIYRVRVVLSDGNVRTKCIMVILGTGAQDPKFI